jgi:hypothetical protein
MEELQAVTEMGFQKYTNTLEKLKQLCILIIQKLNITKFLGFHCKTIMSQD